jgi:hypothetical protein
MPYIEESIKGTRQKDSLYAIMICVTRQASRTSSLEVPEKQITFVLSLIKHFHNHSQTNQSITRLEDSN